MSAKRSRSGADGNPGFIVGVDKPEGLTSHDVVNRVRSIFHVRRVGHSGTLDPMATGALIIEVGSATRLSNYLIDKAKRYEARIVFGAATDTDDGCGRPIHEATVDSRLTDPVYAQKVVVDLTGPITQLPPVYSAIKQDGKRAYDEARAGRVVSLPARDVEVYESRLLSIGAIDGPIAIENERATGFGPWEKTCIPAELTERTDLVFWDVELSVSKGTYIRSIARDLSQSLSCYGFLGALRRTQAGALGVDECVSLDTLAEVRTRAALDPIPLLGMRFCFADGDQACAVRHGRPLTAEAVSIYEGFGDVGRSLGRCVPALRESPRKLEPAELVAVIAEDRVIAIAEYDPAADHIQPRCVLPEGVIRGRAL